MCKIIILVIRTNIDHDFAIDFKNVLQASCDTFDDYLYASDLGFNCFLVKHKDTKAPKDFINCPASIEAGKKTSCSLCSMCSGSGSKRGKNIVYQCSWIIPPNMCL